MSVTLETIAPERIEQIVTWVCAGDRAILEEYDVPSFVRRYIPGEFWPIIYPADTEVTVLCLVEGIAARLPNPYKAIPEEDREKMVKMSGDKARYLVDFEKFCVIGERMPGVIDSRRNKEHQYSL